MKWINKAGTWIAPKPCKPGIWRTRSGGFLIRARPTNPRTGKKVEIRRVLQCTLDEAAATLHQEILLLKNGGDPRKQNTRCQRFADYAAELLKHKISVGEIRSEATCHSWRTVLKMNLLPRFGDFYIDQIRRADLMDYHATLARQVSQQQMSPQSAQTIFKKLKVILRSYVRQHDAERDPTIGIKSFDTSLHRTYTRESPNALLPHEVSAFLATARRLFLHDWAMLALGFATGLRTCSLRPLRKKGPKPDIDLTAGVLLNRRSHTRKHVIMERTKIGVDQEIALPAHLVMILREHIAQLPPGPMQDSELLFPAPDGRLQNQVRLYRIFRTVSAAIGLRKRFTPHGMRRTSKDLLRLAGASQEVSMAISGHLTDAMHYHYSTIGESEQRASLSKVMSLVQMDGNSPTPGGKESGKDRPSQSSESPDSRRKISSDYRLESTRGGSKRGRKK